MYEFIMSTGIFFSFNKLTKNITKNCYLSNNTSTYYMEMK